MIVSPAPPPPLPSARLDELLCFLVYSTGFAFSRVYRKPLQRLGLTYPQYLVMTALWDSDALSVGEVCANMRLDSGTLTPLLKRLEALGLVLRTRSRKDERRVTVTLTAQGRALREPAGEAMRCISDAVGMDQAELAALMRGMQTLRDNLDAAAV